MSVVNLLALKVLLVVLLDDVLDGLVGGDQVRVELAQLLDGSVALFLADHLVVLGHRFKTKAP